MTRIDWLTHTRTYGSVGVHHIVVPASLFRLWVGPTYIVAHNSF